MRVLALTDYFPPDGGGGVERAASEVYRRLVASGQATIQVVTLGSGEHEDELGYGVNRARRVSLERWLGLQVAVAPGALNVARSVLGNFRPDVVHAHTLFFQTSLVGAYLSQRNGIPLVLTMHLGSVAELPARFRYPAMAYENTVGRLLLHAARRVICVSDAVAEHARSLGANESKITVVPNGVDLERFTPEPDRQRGATPTIVCVGRLIVNKGQELLLQAAARLAREGFEFRILLVGEGPMEQRLRQQARRLGLRGIVELAGYRDDVEEVLRHADIFVRPSLTEGMPLAVLEAMAAGLPVVATDIAGTRELLDDQVSGFLVPPGDVSRLAGAMRCLLRDAELRDRLGSKARREVERRGWDDVAHATAEELARATRR